MATEEFVELEKLVKQVDSFKIPIKVTIKTFQKDRIKGLYNERTVKESVVHFPDDAVSEVRNFLIDRIQDLDLQKINYGYVGAIKASGFRFMLPEVMYNDVKPYGRHQKVAVQVIIEKA